MAQISRTSTKRQPSCERLHSILRSPFISFLKPIPNQPQDDHAMTKLAVMGIVQGRFENVWQLAECCPYSHCQQEIVLKIATLIRVANRDHQASQSPDD